MRKVLFIVHLAFFIGWGTISLNSHKEAMDIWVETIPVDPRDYISGHYVALRYGFDTRVGSKCLGLPTKIKDNAYSPSRKIWLRFSPSKKTVMTENGRKTVYQPDRCRLSKPKRQFKEGVWIQGRFDGKTKRIFYNIEKFFVGEESPLRKAKSGDVIAQISVNLKYQPRISGLLSIKKKATDAPEEEAW